jgi:hypothetical protein
MAERDKTRPTLWLLKCPECGANVMIELPGERRPGYAGTEECFNRHRLAYEFDGVTARLSPARAST